MGSASFSFTLLWPQGIALWRSRLLGTLRSALRCSECPSSSPPGDRLCLHLRDYRIVPECSAPPPEQLPGGPFPSAHACGLMSPCGCPTCFVLLWTWPDLLHLHLYWIDTAAVRLRPRHWLRETRLQNAASDFLGLTVPPCHPPSATCVRRDFRRSQGLVHTNPKPCFAMAPGLKFSLGMESRDP